MTQRTVRPALQRRRRNSASRLRGFSLIEIMISLVIGLVVVGAVMVTYLSNSKSSQQQAAYAEMKEYVAAEKDIRASLAIDKGKSSCLASFVKTFLGDFF